MKSSLISPVCVNILKNIKYPPFRKNIRYYTTTLMTKYARFHEFQTFRNPNLRLYSTVEDSKSSEQKSTKDSNEEPDLDEENGREETNLSPEELLNQENELLKQKLSTLETKLKELELKYKMSLSNCDNLCKIHKKELENTKVYAVTEFAKGLLEVADTFELALKHLGESDPKKSTEDFVDGIKMTEAMLHQTFEKFGIKKYESMMEDFDPQIHEAMFEVKDNDSHNKVVQVVKNGYTISGRVLRPAKVGVSKRQ
ncbi:co-chaperone (GrpE) [Theileria annulata]|uniref:Co-chaperone (GrpE homologue), putative n=1 Tax=Theileria annulata TaxID=5874 RepID=Q4UIE1_THEAN|nr:co-chaperone (GrpE) [Theileria annulata]CAI73148.1 co-chaperone (GrpE homologue), putative [Theileria annulata]|eukprot:XP_953826.1 co-chaperone (GrpE homologue), putative [Theileria annulata]